MDTEPRYPNRLIEVDLPIRAISAHARRDKKVRKGHLHKWHIWWATRPLASCRAVTLATMLPDPLDDACPSEFRAAATQILKQFTRRDLDDPRQLRNALLSFVADFASWEAGVSPAYLEVARQLVAAAHPAGTPLVVDPFAGAGSFPFESLRLGANTFASDLNPVAVMLNKVALKYLPRYQSELSAGVNEWGAWVLGEARKRLADYYPSELHGKTPHAYYWARTIDCEGPGCGTTVPLLGMLWLSRDKGRNCALRYTGDARAKSVEIDVFTPRDHGEVQPGLSKRFSVTCPVCDYTTPYRRVREQVRTANGGTRSSRLLAVGLVDSTGDRTYQVPCATDSRAVAAARKALDEWSSSYDGPLPLIPTEPYPDWYSGVFNPGLWGIETWGDFFTERQALAMATFVDLVRQVSDTLRRSRVPHEYATAVTTCLALAVTKMSIYNAATCYIHPDFGLKTVFLGAGMAMVGDFAEINPLTAKYVGGFEYSYKQVVGFLDREAGSIPHGGDVQQASATAIPLPDDSAPYVITDPPYYAAVPYSYLSDYCYVWLKRMLSTVDAELTANVLTEKREELIAYYVQPPNAAKKDNVFFEEAMERALAEARRVLAPNGVGVVVFAHKGTAGWEALLTALVNAGWTVTASWPIDTENQQRWRAAGSAALGSSVHLVCRPRENRDGSLRVSDVGDWRAVLRELPVRIHQWMPRLAREGIVGADAIFACLGPALEVFSRYSRVEKASGEVVGLRDYLEHVWAAVAREALSMVLEGADTSNLEEDARLTAMWLWTLSASPKDDGADNRRAAATPGKRKARLPKFMLEFDAARKIAQGLGAHLEDLDSVVEVKGDEARLRAVVERTQHLFGGSQPRQAARRAARGKGKQLTLFDELEAAEKDAGWGDVGLPSAGATTLDRVHQTMVLFAAGRTEAVKRFLVEEGVGREFRFWKLAQALSALYPAETDEKRWVDGVLARKKGLGF